MKKLILLLLALILTACSAGTLNEFDKNLAKWEAAKITHYRYDVAIGCFCAFRDDMPMTIEINNGEIVSITSVKGNIITPSDDLYDVVKSYAGMEALFEQLKGAFEDADRVEVIYDTVNGYPTSIAIDQIEAAVDDELYISVENFEVLK
ncbi:MAG TPA: DUF6174 domain-containing protein [Anaerolineales bacterium]|nr:DUF6174 domain-containing protein [Anaerolineales bacterium]